MTARVGFPIPDGQDGIFIGSFIFLISSIRPSFHAQVSALGIEALRRFDLFIAGKQIIPIINGPNYAVIPTPYLHGSVILLVIGKAAKEYICSVGGLHGLPDGSGGPCVRVI